MSFCPQGSLCPGGGLCPNKGSLSWEEGGGGFCHRAPVGHHSGRHASHCNALQRDVYRPLLWPPLDVTTGGCLPPGVVCFWFKVSIYHPFTTPTLSPCSFFTTRTFTTPPPFTSLPPHSHSSHPRKNRRGQAARQEVTSNPPPPLWT